MWFQWANCFDIITAWRKVGIAGNTIVPQMIDRSQFIDRREQDPTSPPAQTFRKRSIDDLTATPEGIESGSAASLEHKLKKLKEYTKQLEEEVEKPYDAVRGGLLVPEKVAPPERRTTKSRLSDMSGSVTMRDILNEKERRKAEEEAAEQAATARREENAKKKALADEQKQAMLAAFERCEFQCNCGLVPCPYAKWKRCPQCGPKNHACRVRLCIEKRMPLALTYVPPPEA